jgi:hypothetical protein
MVTMHEHMTPQQEVERERTDKAFRGLLSTEDGRRAIFWMLEQCGIYRDAFAGENNATNYQLGAQGPGRRLIDRLDGIDPRLYPRLLIDMADIREIDKAEADARARNMENDDDETA